jgi:hypothetical protein
MKKRTLFAEIYLDLRIIFAKRKYDKRYKQISSYLNKQINDADIFYPINVGRWDMESTFSVLYLGIVIDMSLFNIAHDLLFVPNSFIKILPSSKEKTKSYFQSTEEWERKEIRKKNGKEIKLAILSLLPKEEYIKQQVNRYC